MRIKIITALLLSSMAFCASTDKEMQDPDLACKYNGFDMNVGVGYWGMSAEKTTTDSDTDHIKNDVGASGLAIQGRVGGTYGFCKRWIIGLDGYAQYNNSYHTFSRNSSAASFKVTEKEEIQANYGLDARLGVVGTPSNMYYLTSGPDFGYFKHHRRTILNGVTFIQSDTYQKIGFKVGGGAEQKFGEHWIIKEQFSYSWFDSYKFTHLDGAPVSMKVRMATILFMAGYLF
jgi:opacity protein-like surface antigen